MKNGNLSKAAPVEEDDDPPGKQEQDRRYPLNENDDSPPTTPQCIWEDLTGFQRDLVQTIMLIERQDEELPTGQEIRDQLEHRYTTSINHGRLYQNLGTLEEEGFVEKTPVDGRTNAYYLRDEAYDVLADAIRESAEACGILLDEETGT